MRNISSVDLKTGVCCMHKCHGYDWSRLSLNTCNNPLWYVFAGQLHSGALLRRNHWSLYPTWNRENPLMAWKWHLPGSVLWPPYPTVTLLPQVDGGGEGGCEGARGRW